MALTDEFKAAAEAVKSLRKRPSDQELLKLYALYKQAVEGDVEGSRPSIFDLKARKKFDSWADLKGLAREAAMTKYIEYVNQLKG